MLLPCSACCCSYRNDLAALTAGWGCGDPFAIPLQFSEPRQRFYSGSTPIVVFAPGGNPLNFNVLVPSTATRYAEGRLTFRPDLGYSAYYYLQDPVCLASVLFVFRESCTEEGLRHRLTVDLFLFGNRKQIFSIDSSPGFEDPKTDTRIEISYGSEEDRETFVWQFDRSKTVDENFANTVIFDKEFDVGVNMFPVVVSGKWPEVAGFSQADQATRAFFRELDATFTGFSFFLAEQVLP